MRRTAPAVRRQLAAGDGAAAAGARRRRPGGEAAGARRRRQGERRAAGARRRRLDGVAGGGRQAAAPGRRRQGGGRRGVPPRTRLSPASRARIASRPCSANSSAPRVAPRIASQPLVRPRSGPRRGNSPDRAAGGWRLARHTGCRIRGHTGRRITGHTGRRITGRTGRRITGHTGRRIRGPMGRRIRGHTGRRIRGQTKGRTSSRRSRAMPRGRTCRPSRTALVDRQRRIGCRMRMWPKAWPHRHVASPPMPGPHDDVALPRAVWLQGCAVERLQRRNDRASARLRGWWAISYELSNAKPRECSPPPRKLDARAFPPERPSPGRRLCSGVATSLCSCPKQASWGARARSRRSRCGHIVVWPSFETPIVAVGCVAFGAVSAGPTALTWPRSAAWPHRQVAAGGKPPKRGCARA